MRKPNNSDEIVSQSFLKDFAHRPTSNQRVSLSIQAGQTREVPRISGIVGGRR